MTREEAIEAAIRRAVSILGDRADTNEMLRFWLSNFSAPTLDPMITYSVRTIINAEFFRLYTSEKR